MKSKDQQLLEEAYARIVCEELDRNINDLDSLSDEELLQLFLAAKKNELGVWPPEARTEEQKEKAKADSEKYFAKIEERGGDLLAKALFYSRETANN